MTTGKILLQLVHASGVQLKASFRLSAGVQISLFIITFKLSSCSSFYSNIILMKTLYIHSIILNLVSSFRNCSPAFFLCSGPDISPFRDKSASHAKCKDFRSYAALWEHILLPYLNQFSDSRFLNVQHFLLLEGCVLRSLYPCCIKYF